MVFQANIMLKSNGMKKNQCSDVISETNIWVVSSENKKSIIKQLKNPSMLQKFPTLMLKVWTEKLSVTMCTEKNDYSQN